MNDGTFCATSFWKEPTNQRQESWIRNRLFTWSNLVQSAYPQFHTSKIIVSKLMQVFKISRSPYHGDRITPVHNIFRITKSSKWCVQPHPFQSINWSKFSQVSQLNESNDFFLTCKPGVFHECVHFQQVFSVLKRFRSEESHALALGSLFSPKGTPRTNTGRSWTNPQIRFWRSSFFYSLRGSSILPIMVWRYLRLRHVRRWLGVKGR